MSSTTGGENSVVQMIGSLYDSIENHYGTLATRLYRAFRPKPGILLIFLKSCGQIFSCSQIVFDVDLAENVLSALCDIIRNYFLYVNSRCKRFNFLFDAS